MDMGDKEDFAAKNLPQKISEQILYNGTGKSYEDKHAEIPKRTERSEAGCVMPTAKYLPKPGTTCLPSNAGPVNAANQKYLHKPGTMRLHTCLPSTARPANADTHKYFPKPGIM